MQPSMTSLASNLNESVEDTLGLVPIASFKAKKLVIYTNFLLHSYSCGATKVRAANSLSNIKIA